MRKRIFLLILFFWTLSACAQIDTEFWFAAPDVSSSHDYDRPVALRISAFQQACNVTISQPATGGMPTQTISIPPNSTQTVTLTAWIDNIECAPGNLVQNKGIKIISDNKIAVYYEVNVGGPNPELFALKGKNAIGNEFYISSQYLLGNSPVLTPAPISSFNIVATEDNTLVTITPTNPIVGHAAGAPFAITLNKGQTYAAIATSQLASQHLQGSHVVSDKPIAITLADDLLQGTAFGGPCEDLAGDQTVPVNIIGMEYIAIKTSLNSPFDKVYVLATQDGTQVKQDGVVQTTLNKGQSTQLTVSNPSTYIQTSLPAYAYHLSGAGCEVGSAVLPKINCTGSSRVSVARSNSEPFVVAVLIKDGHQGNFLVNNVAGVINSAQFSTVPTTGGQWVFARVTLPLSNYPVGTVITVTNSTNIFQMGITQGGVQGASVGYFSDYNTIKAAAATATPRTCIGSNIELSAETISSALYSWEGPNGYSSTSPNNTIPNAALVNGGKYIVTVTIPGCGVSKDSVNIMVSAPSTASLNHTICEGQTYNGHTSTGSYTDHFTNSGGCDSTLSLSLTVKPKAFGTVSASICEGVSYEGYTTSGTFQNTFVAANGCDSIRTLTLTVTPSKRTSLSVTICEGRSYVAGGAAQTQSGIYQDVLQAQSGCDSIISTTLTVLPKPVVSLGADKNICSNDPLLLAPGSFTTYTWQDGSINPTFLATAVGKYWVTVTDNNNCSNADTIDIKRVFPAPINFLRPTDSLCEYGQMELFPLNSYPNYTWSTGSVQPYIIVTNPGQYHLAVIDRNNCKGVDTIQIYQKKCNSVVYFPSAFTPNNNGVNDEFKAAIFGTIVSWRLQVFNRQGELVFTATDPLKGWNGIFKNGQQGSNTFVWQCYYQLAGDKPTYKKGFVTLIR